MDRPTRGPWEVCNAIDVYPVGDTRARRHIADCDVCDAPLSADEDHPDTDMSFAECKANARLIAAAGTVANQLYDAGLDGIEAVKALPELIKAASEAKEFAKSIRSTRSEICSERDRVCWRVEEILARLKGDAE